MTPFGARIRVADSFRFFDIQEIVGIHSLWQLSPNTVLLTGSCLPLSGLAHVRPDLLSTAGCVANKFFGGFSFTFVVRVFSNFFICIFSMLATVSKFDLHGRCKILCIRQKNEMNELINNII